MRFSDDNAAIISSNGYENFWPGNREFRAQKKAFFRTILLQFFGERRREFLAKGMVGHSFPQERREFYGDACAIFQVMMHHFFSASGVRNFCLKIA